MRQLCRDGEAAARCPGSPGSRATSSGRGRRTTAALLTQSQVSPPSPTMIVSASAKRVDLRGQPVGMDGRLLGRQRLGEGLGAGAAHVVQRRQPGVRGRGQRRATRALEQLAQRLAAVADDAQLDLAVRPISSPRMSTWMTCASRGMSDRWRPPVNSPSRAPRMSTTSGRPGRRWARSCRSPGGVSSGTQPRAFSLLKNGRRSARRTRAARRRPGEPDAAAGHDRRPLGARQQVERALDRPAARRRRLGSIRSGNSTRSSSTRAKSTSIGISRKTGPGRPVIAWR